MTIRTNRVLHQVQFLTPILHGKETKNLNVGLTLAFLMRLSFSFDYYNRLTTDLLQDVPNFNDSGFHFCVKKT